MYKWKLAWCFFALVLLMSVPKGELWCEPLSEQGVGGVTGTSANEDNDRSTTQVQKQGEAYSGTEGNNDDGIIEEEFPLDERDEEDADRGTSKETVPERKENKQSAGLYKFHHNWCSVGIQRIRR